MMRINLLLILAALLLGGRAEGKAPGDRSFVIVAGADFSIRVIDPATHAVEKVLTGHQGEVTALAVDSAHHRLASKSKDMTIRIWDLGTGECVKVLSLIGTVDNSPIAFSGNGCYFAYTDLLTLTVMDTQGWSKVEAFSCSRVSSLVFVHHDHWLVMGDAYDKTAYVLDLLEETPTKKLQPDVVPAYVSAVLVAVDEGRKLLVSCFDTVVQFRRLPGLEVVRTLRLPYEAQLMQIDAKHGQLRIGVQDRADRAGELVYSLDMAAKDAGVITGDPYWPMDVQAYSAITSYHGNPGAPPRVPPSREGPGIQIQRGHSTAISWLTNSPDRRYIVSCDQQQIKIWDSRSQLLLKTLSLRQAGSYRLKCVMRDSTLVLAFDNQTNVLLQWWNWVTGIQYRERILRGQGCNMFTEDGLVGVNQDGTFSDAGTIMYDLLGDSVFRRLPPVYEATLSPRKDIIAGINVLDGAIDLYDYRTGMKIDSLRGIFYGAPNAGTLKFSTHGRYLAIGANWHNRLEIWDLDKRKAVYTEPEGAWHDFALEEGPDQLVISRGTSFLDDNGKLEVRQLPSGKLIDTLPELQLHQAIPFLRYDGDGNLYLGTGSGDCFIKDHRGRYNITVLPGSQNGYSKVLRYDRQANTLLVEVGNSLKRVDPANVSYEALTPEGMLPGAYIADVQGRAFGVLTPDASALMIQHIGGHENIRIAMPDTAFLLLRLDYQRQELAYQSLLHTLVYYRGFDKAPLRIPLPDSFFVESFVRSHDGKYLAYCNFGGKTFLYDVGARKALLIDSIDDLNHGLEFSADDRFLINYGARMKFIPVAHPFSGRFRLVEQSGTGRVIADTTDGDRLVSAGYDGLVRVWSIRDREVVSSFDLGHRLTEITASGEKDVYFVLSTDYELYRIDLRENKILNTFYLGPEACLITDTLGNYMTTSYAYRNFGFTLDGNCYGLEQFDALYNRPDKVLASFGYVGQGALDLYRRVYAKRLEKLGPAEDVPGQLDKLPTVTIDDAELDTAAGSFMITGSAASPAGLLKEIRVRANDIPIVDAAFRLDARRQGRFAIRVPLETGANTIRLTVVDDHGRESLERLLHVDYLKPYVPDIYFVGLGSAVYQSYDPLPYVDNDVRMLCKSFSGKQDSWFHRLYVDTLLNQDLTLAHFGQLHSFLAKARVGDIVVVFYSGHGKLQDSTYYLASYDIDFNKPAERGIPYERLEQLMDSIAPRNRLLLINACNAGEYDRDKEIFVRMKTLFADLRPGNGATIVAASASDKSALTSTDRPLSNFGAALQMAIAGEKDLLGDVADRDGDGIIRVDELIAYVRQRVIELSHGKQVPTIRRINPEKNFQVW